MLKPSKFSDILKGIDKVLEVIECKTGDDVKFEKEVKEKKRRKTWYLDTVDFTLNYRHNFLLRIREEEEIGKYDTTLKCRHPDRYLSAFYDLSSPKKNLQTKFEEDISTPFISKFSNSASFEENKKPDMSYFEDLMSIFPNLNVLDISVKEPLKKVNNFEPNEISYKIGTLEVTDKKSVNLYLNLWYSTNSVKNSLPLIVEFTFDYEAKKQSEKTESLLEEFPLTVARTTNYFYHLLQDKEIADLNTTKTKTDFAYKHKPH